MKKLALVLLALLTIVFMGCASATINGSSEKAGVPQPTEKPTPSTNKLNLPMVAPINPANVTILDSMIAMAEEEDWKFLGMGADIEDDTMVWFESPNGECIAFFMVFSQGRTIPLQSCEEALSAWRECVDSGMCDAGNQAI